MHRKWKSVPGYEGLYIISEFGDVYSLKTSKIISATMSRGYRTIGLRLSGKTFMHKIHRLVLMAFKSMPNHKHVANHIDGNKLNNHISNLEWCSQKENVRHAINIGKYRTPPAGILHGKAKLTDSEVIEIATWIALGEKQSSIAKAYNVCQTTISRIKLNKGWQHLDKTTLLRSGNGVDIEGVRQDGETL